MAASTRRHRVIQHALVNGMRDHLMRDRLNLSLTDGTAAVRSARRYADHFHSYAFTDRNGTPRHVAYARYLPGSTKHGFSKVSADLDVIYMFEVTAEAVAASPGLDHLTAPIESRR